MLALVMKGEKLPPPLWEEYAADMGGVVSGAAAYRNYSSAIGYSFRYFVKGMNQNENIKLLAINGVEPTPDNIRNGSYPFSTEGFAVTSGPRSENAQKLISWLTSEQGQNFVERCGYVKR
jgi:phosphate transport system substrate-binding protein